MRRSVTRRRWTWLIVLCALSAIDLAATIHAHLTWKRTAGGPTVMPLGQLLGWVSSTLLVIAVVLALITGISSRRQRRQRYR
jgi:hypothetical protein